MNTGVPSRPALPRRPCLRNLTGHRDGTPSERLNPRFHIHRFQAFLACLGEEHLQPRDKQHQQPSGRTVTALTIALDEALRKKPWAAWTEDEKSRFSKGPQGPEYVEWVGALTDPAAETAPDLDRYSSPPTSSPMNPESPDGSHSRAGLDRGTFSATAHPELVADESRHSKRLLTRRNILVAGVGASLGIAFALYRAADQQQPAPYGRIAVPEPGAQITSPTDLRGFASVGGNMELWVLSKAPDNIFYTVTSNPAPLAVNASGEWTLNDVGVGKNVGDVHQKYEFFLVTCPEAGVIASAVEERNRMSARFEQIPADTAVLHSVPVELAAWS